MRTLLRFQFYDEDSIWVGTLYECGLYLRLYGRRQIWNYQFCHFNWRTLDKWDSIIVSNLIFDRKSIIIEWWFTFTKSYKPNIYFFYQRLSNIDGSKVHFFIRTYLKIHMIQKIARTVPLILRLAIFLYQMDFQICSHKNGL